MYIALLHKKNRLLIVKLASSTKPRSSKVKHGQINPKLRQNSQIKHKKTVHAERISNQATYQNLVYQMMFIQFYLLFDCKFYLLMNRIKL